MVSTLRVLWLIFVALGSRVVFTSKWKGQATGIETKAAKSKNNHVKGEICAIIFETAL